MERWANTCLNRSRKDRLKGFRIVNETTLLRRFAIKGRRETALRKGKVVLKIR